MTCIDAGDAWLRSRVYIGGAVVFAAADKMTDLLIRKLELFGPLGGDDRQVIEAVTSKPRSVASHTDIIHEGDTPNDVHLVLEGLCCRYKILPDGSRQIFAYLVPGDFCDLNIFILKEMDHGIATLAPSEIVDIPRSSILDLCDRPRIARALWWVTLVDEATLREWIVNLGQRDAEERIAHLFCELPLRLQSVGLTTDGGFQLPLTQAELADTVGLSAVHVNRSLQSLRAQNLIEFKGKVLDIPDVHRLRAIAGFRSNYLHLDGAGKEDRLRLT